MVAIDGFRHISLLAADAPISDRLAGGGVFLPVRVHADDEAGGQAVPTAAQRGPARGSVAFGEGDVNALNKAQGRTTTTASSGARLRVIEADRAGVPEGCDGRRIGSPLSRRRGMAVDCHFRRAPNDLPGPPCQTMEARRLLRAYPPARTPAVLFVPVETILLLVEGQGACSRLWWPDRC